MRIGFIVIWTYAAALGIVGCRNEQPAPAEPAAPAAAPPATGSVTDARDANVDVTLPLAASAVARCEPSKTSYAKGEAMQLAIDLNEAPEGLKVSAKLLDAKGKVVADVARPGAGQKSVTIQIDEKLPAGKYRLEGYWGGNIVCEHEITVK